MTSVLTPLSNTNLSTSILSVQVREPFSATAVLLRPAADCHALACLSQGSASKKLTSTPKGVTTPAEKKTPSSRMARTPAESRQSRRVSFGQLEHMAAPERTERYAMPTPIAARSLSVQGDFTPLRTTESPTGEVTAVGIFHPSPTVHPSPLAPPPTRTGPDLDESGGDASPGPDVEAFGIFPHSPMARSSPLAPPPTRTGTNLDEADGADVTTSASPMAATGRVNEHLRFDSGGEARMVRAGCWVASSPLGGDGALTLWYKCDEPEPELSSGWSAEEWSAWDRSQWEVRAEHPRATSNSQPCCAAMPAMPTATCHGRQTSSVPAATCRARCHLPCGRLSPCPPQRLSR